MSSLLEFSVWVGLSIHFLGLISFLIFYFKRLPRFNSDSPPGVTIIKPCNMLKDGEELNFQTFFAQKYNGNLELIFVVSEISDPSIPVIQSLIDKNPNVDAKIHLSTTRLAYWKKIDAYYDGYQVAKHDHLIISDSDTVVEENYVEKMVACLEQPGVSLVTTPQYDIGADGVFTAKKVLGNNCDVAIYVMLMNLFVRKKKIAFGHSIGFKKSEFDSFGENAWFRLQNYFGDDLILPSLFAENGKRVVYRNIYCPVRFSKKTFSQVLDQQKRFAVCQKIALGPGIYIAGLFLSPVLTSTAFMIVTSFSSWSINLFLASLITRVIVSLVFEGVMHKSIKPTLKYFWTIPLWDWLKAYLVLQALKPTKVKYHGQVYKITSEARLLQL